MTTRDDKSDWSGCPDTLVEFVGWYAERSVGRSAMYSSSNILESMPAVLDVEVRTAWYVGEDTRKQDLAGVATDVVLLFEHAMVGKGRESALHIQNEREIEMTTQERWDVRVQEAQRVEEKARERFVYAQGQVEATGACRAWVEVRDNVHRAWLDAEAEIRRIKDEHEREMEMATQEQDLEIVVRYRAVDGYGETRKYKTVAGAAWFVRKWLGRYPDCHGTHSGVSADGVSRVRITGSPVEVYELVQLGEMLLQRRGG